MRGYSDDMIDDEPPSSSTSIDGFSATSAVCKSCGMPVPLPYIYLVNDMQHGEDALRTHSEEHNEVPVCCDRDVGVRSNLKSTIVNIASLPLTSNTRECIDVALMRLPTILKAKLLWIEEFRSGEANSTSAML